MEHALTCACEACEAEREKMRTPPGKTQQQLHQIADALYHCPRCGEMPCACITGPKKVEFKRMIPERYLTPTVKYTADQLADARVKIEDLEHDLERLTKQLARADALHMRVRRMLRDVMTEIDS